MVQEIIALVILVATLGYVVFAVVNALTKKPANPCNDCSGCDLKNEITKNSLKKPLSPPHDFCCDSKENKCLDPVEKKGV